MLINKANPPSYIMTNGTIDLKKYYLINFDTRVYGLDDGVQDTYLWQFFLSSLYLHYARFITCMILLKELVFLAVVSMEVENKAVFQLSKKLLVSGNYASLKKWIVLDTN